MTKIYYPRVRGLTHSNHDGSSRQEIAKTLRKGHPVTLKANPQNEFDRWAVEVHDSNGRQIGFLPSDARDASAILKGEPISAKVHRLTGGTNWFSRIILGKKNIGVILELTKGEPDWNRYSRLSDIASPIDKLIKKASISEKSGDIQSAIQLYRESILKINELTARDPFASAHRRSAAPISRLSLLLEKHKDYQGALRVIEEHYTTYDPIQPDKSEKESIKKRYERLTKKLNNHK